MKERYIVALSPEAREDLVDLYTYTAFSLRAPDTAGRLVGRIRKAARSLELMPARHAVVDWEPWKGMGMRRLPVAHFLIFYSVEDAAHRVNIVRIMYGGQDIAGMIQAGPKP